MRQSALAGAVALALLACSERDEHEPPYRGESSPIEGLPHARQEAESFVSHRDWLRPLVAPDWRPADRADHMRAEDPVLGLVRGSRSWAIPWWVMKNHHLAELELAGEPVLVTFCEMCSGAAAFDPRHGGTLHRFQRGGAYNGTFLLRDGATGSFWSPFDGEALVGPLAGARLRRLPLLQGRWSEWRRLHPETLVAFAPPGMRRYHGSDQHPGRAGIAGYFAETLAREIDPRLPPHELVLGVEHRGQTLALPLAALERAGPVSRHELGGESVWVIAEPGTLLAAAYLGERGGRPIELALSESGAVVDRETGSEWSVSGRAVDGPLRGADLEFVRSGTEEWYVWAAYHPETGVFDAP